GSHAFSTISAGATSTCGLSTFVNPRTGNTSVGLFCWGLLVTGTTNTVTPTLIRSASGLTGVSVGNGHVCTTTAFGGANEIDCGGMDNYGQLGVDPTTLGTTVLGPFSTLLTQPPLFSSLGNNASRVSAGGVGFGFGGGHAYTCADQANDVVQCVGDND